MEEEEEEVTLPGIILVAWMAWPTKWMTMFNQSIRSPFFQVGFTRSIERSKVCIFTSGDAQPFGLGLFSFFEVLELEDLPNTHATHTSFFARRHVEEKHHGAESWAPLAESWPQKEASMPCLTHLQGMIHFGDKSKPGIPVHLFRVSEKKIGPRWCLGETAFRSVCLVPSDMFMLGIPLPIAPMPRSRCGRRVQKNRRGWGFGMSQESTTHQGELHQLLAEGQKGLQS